MQKKNRLGLQRKQIFNQGSFFFLGGGGGKAIWGIVQTSEKTWLRPCPGVLL